MICLHHQTLLSLTLHSKMRNFIYISLLSLISSVALAMGLIDGNPCLSLHECDGGSSLMMQSYVEAFQLEANSDSESYFLLSNRNSVTAHNSATQRHSSRRNSIYKSYNSAIVKGGKSLDCRTVSAYRKTKLFPLAARCGESLIFRLHKLLI